MGLPGVYGHGLQSILTPRASGGQAFWPEGTASSSLRLASFPYVLLLSFLRK